jgi:hypothetical protein
MINIARMEYKFAVKEHYIEDCLVNGSEETTKGMINIARDIIYHVNERTRVSIFCWPGFPKMTPIRILEGPHEGRIGFIDSNDLIPEYQ